MKTLVQDVEGSLRDLTELYIVVKEIVIFSEEIDKDKKADIQILNELRNAFDHLMRVYASYFQIEREKDEGYIKLHLNKAFGHVYRAGFDSLDKTTLFLRKYIANEVDGFSPETYQAAFPEYYESIRPEIEEIDNDIAIIRLNKDVGNPNYDNFRTYVNHMKTLKGYYEVVLKRKASLLEFENRIKNTERGKDMKTIGEQIIIGILLVILGGVLKSLFF
ncbi:MAG: hypothetical protein JW878_01730 [Methanomicrobia archaeon]|nr:hypothetical protein [Methanomicrobia archaeon]